MNWCLVVVMKKPVKPLATGHEQIERIDRVVGEGVVNVRFGEISGAVTSKKTA